jgi:CRISPR system Cascade subunit CasB
MLNETQSRPLANTVFNLAKSIVILPPGPLARLRRMDIDGPGEGDFWKLAVEHDLKPPEHWLTPIRLMALLTPKGAPSGSKKLHDSKTPLGKALAYSKYPETRLLRFLATPVDRRGEPLERMVRWLATKGHDGVNCTDVCALLFKQSPVPARRLAETYYNTLAQETAKKDQENKDSTL